MSRAEKVWITVLALLTSIAPLATDMYLPALPRVVDDLGTTASGVQLTLTAFLVGLALGQLVIGPLSDARGRRPLLLIGASVCALAGLGAAFAPTVGVLVGARFVQGFAGAAGIVLARAVIVDRTSGRRTAQLFTLMMAINGVAPVVAPLVGSGLVDPIGWRGIFVVLAGLAVLMVVGVLVAVPESLPVERRRTGGLRRTAADIASVLRRGPYVAWTLVLALSFSTMFAYISGSSFVLQDVLGLSTVGYAAAFASNAAGLVLVSVLGARWDVDPRRKATIGVAILVTAAAALLAVTAAGAPVWPVLVLLFLAVSSLGLIMGNATALATGHARDVAGTASALLGAGQFGLGAAVSPLVGSSASAMAAVMLGASGLAVIALVTARRLDPADAPTTPAAAAV
ncbi:multidrug effflux MFS transporter [Pseudonocardia petroleophila]|uniref:Multidrug effflux MFS transporter n=1 Tax=Pseudonocardia petroleophila TaxID=37331 RepID=A0A7G7MN62_9PSEU|nr:multidrug effflux MFS transporter [Pseudonocardia petroleophila]QNG54223.1 multidrug effflux MFS transporter [Pseudonocardia petroleophila]